MVECNGNCAIICTILRGLVVSRRKYFSQSGLNVHTSGEVAKMCRFTSLFPVCFPRNLDAAPPANVQYQNLFPFQVAMLSKLGPDYRKLFKFSLACMKVAWCPRGAPIPPYIA